MQSIYGYLLAISLFVSYILPVVWGKKWSYITTLAILSLNVFWVGLNFVYGFENYEDDVSFILTILAIPLVVTNIGLFVRFPISLRFLIGEILLFCVFGMAVIAPYQFKINQSNEIVSILKTKQALANSNVHFHNGRICSIGWDGPVTQYEFDLIIKANPKNGIKFTNTTLTPEQEVLYQKYCSQITSKGH